MNKNRVFVIFSSHLDDESNNTFKEKIKNSIGSTHAIHCIKNFNEFSLSEVYNQGIDYIRYGNLHGYNLENTVFVFCHNDIEFKTKNWGKILINKFNRNDYQILGVAGSTYLPKNCVWWNDRSKMVGIVEHSNDTDTWVSEYSNEKKGSIIPTVLVDGLFIAVDCNDIEHYWDERNFDGFHFYDLGFCIPNYLDGCNIGVTTDIRILHKSVGQTNDEWENNKNIFIQKYESYLPIKHVNDKLKVLICCQFYSSYTGSEMSNFEMAKELVKQGCDVTVISTKVGDPLLSKSKKAGIKVYEVPNVPNFKVVQNSLAFMKNEVDFDIIHINHKPIGELILKLYPNTPAVMHVRSEVIPVFEEPIINENIKRYISIRESITNYMVNSFNIPNTKIVNIDNPFDISRFNTNYTQINNEKEIVLFIGTLDHLRHDMLFDLKESTKLNNQDLWVIGDNTGGYIDELLNESNNITYYGVVSDVENYIKKCDYTAGIFRGRSTIEGFLCGKRGIIYNVDASGKISSKDIVEVPNDLNKYSSEYSINKIINLYNQVINETYNYLV